MSSKFKISAFDYYLVKYQLVKLSSKALTDLYDSKDLYETFLFDIQAISTIYNDDFIFFNQDIVDKQLSFINLNRDKYKDPDLIEFGNMIIRNLNRRSLQFEKEAYLKKEVDFRGIDSSKFYYTEENLMELVEQDYLYVQRLHTDELAPLVCDSNFLITTNYMLKRTPNLFFDRQFNIFFKMLGVIKQSLSLPASIKEISNKHFYKKLARVTMGNINKFVGEYDIEMTNLINFYEAKINKTKGKNK